MPPRLRGDGGADRGGVRAAAQDAARRLEGAGRGGAAGAGGHCAGAAGGDAGGGGVRAPAGCSSTRRPCCIRRHRRSTAANPIVHATPSPPPTCGRGPGGGVAACGDGSRGGCARPGSAERPSKPQPAISRTPPAGATPRWRPDSARHVEIAAEQQHPDGERSGRPVHQAVGVRRTRRRTAPAPRRASPPSAPRWPTIRAAGGSSGRWAAAAAPPPRRTRRRRRGPPRTAPILSPGMLLVVPQPECPLYTPGDAPR